jgi:hypothetical protein
MSELPQFRPGDVVVHPRRREWGQGVVERATDMSHRGQAGQRLVISFSHHGRTTLNTPMAPLMLKDVADQMTSRTTSVAPDKGWLGALAGQGPDTGNELQQLPEAMADPFASIDSRLRATLESYRYSTEPRSLFDWAIAQTGLDDPLTKYTRHELEQAFPRFARLRDKHLAELVRQVKRSGSIQLLNEALKQSRIPAASQALQNAMRR